jgi:hypothetical protein
MRPVNELPPFITQGLYRRYLRPGEIVIIVTHRGNAGMLFQVASGFYFRIDGGYINASLTPQDAVPHAVTLVAHPDKGRRPVVRGLHPLVRGGGDPCRAGPGGAVDAQLLHPARYARHLSGRRDRLPGGSLARWSGAPVSN